MDLVKLSSKHKENQPTIILPPISAYLVPPQLANTFLVCTQKSRATLTDLF